MKKKIAVAATVFFFLASVSFAADNESWIQKIKNKFQKKETVETKKSAPVNDVKKPEVPVKQRKDMTKSELVADITKNLDREESILNMIPGLEKNSDPEGKEYYTYNGTRLENLDKDTLDKIFSRVRGEALRLRTNKLEKQLETVRRANTATMKVPQVPRVPVSPRVNTPPQPPRSVQPPAPPRVPPAPPRS